MVTHAVIPTPRRQWQKDYQVFKANRGYSARHCLQSIKNQTTTQRNKTQFNNRKKVSIQKLRQWTHFTKIYTNGFKYMKRTKGQKNNRKRWEKCLTLQNLSRETIIIWKNQTEILEFKSINEKFTGKVPQQTGSSGGDRLSTAKVNWDDIMGHRRWERALWSKAAQTDTWPIHRDS